MTETAGGSYACNDERENMENPHRFTFQGLYCDNEVWQCKEKQRDICKPVLW